LPAPRVTPHRRSPARSCDGDGGSSVTRLGDGDGAQAIAPQRGEDRRQRADRLSVILVHEDDRARVQAGDHVALDSRVVGSERVTAVDVPQYLEQPSERTSCSIAALMPSYGGRKSTTGWSAARSISLLAPTISWIIAACVSAGRDGCVIV
jgi:hypothetical protein